MSTSKLAKKSMERLALFLFPVFPNTLHHSSDALSVSTVSFLARGDINLKLLVSKINDSSSTKSFISS